MQFSLTLCPGGACATKNICFRHRAKIYGRSNSFGTPPLKIDGSCDQWVPFFEVGEHVLKIHMTTSDLHSCPSPPSLDLGAVTQGNFYYIDSPSGAKYYFIQLDSAVHSVDTFGYDINIPAGTYFIIHRSEVELTNN